MIREPLQASPGPAATRCAADRQEYTLAEAIGLWAPIRLWAERRRHRKALARLGDDLLADIGLSPKEAAREAAKPFWRG
jgi:uncharacterized protein YjiS (DUF1127 family)